MVVNVKNRELIVGVKRVEKYKLSKKRLRLLLLLSDNNVHTIKEIEKYCKTKKPEHLMYNLKKQIRNLDIVTLVKFGYRLDDKIFIE